MADALDTRAALRELVSVVHEIALLQQPCGAPTLDRLRVLALALRDAAPPPPARTVTRAQYGRALDVLRDWIGLSGERRMQRIISALGLRVADDTEARDG